MQHGLHCYVCICVYLYYLFPPFFLFFWGGGDGGVETCFFLINKHFKMIEGFIESQSWKGPSRPSNFCSMLESKLKTSPQIGIQALLEHINTTHYLENLLYYQKYFYCWDFDTTTPTRICNVSIIPYPALWENRKYVLVLFSGMSLQTLKKYNLRPSFSFFKD